MNAESFLADIEASPQALDSLADAGADDWAGLPRAHRTVLVGMGSSAYAANVTAARLQAIGLDAVSVLASSDTLPAAAREDLVIVVSAGGSSPETVAAAQHYAGRAPQWLLTNSASGPLVDLADRVVPLHAGPETGGVACRSFRHTLARLRQFEDALLERQPDPLLLLRAREAATDLLERRPTWLAQAVDLLGGGAMTGCVGPVSRLANAQQSALMLREGPRRIAVGCETGDWSHVDVYLTKTQDYRVLLLAGSRWEPELLRWCGERGSQVLAAGAEVEGAAMSLRYRHDDDANVRLLVESIIAELVAQALWSAQG